MIIIYIWSKILNILKTFQINITNNLGGNLDKEKKLKITDINSISNNKKDTKIIEQQIIIFMITKNIM